MNEPAVFELFVRHLPPRRRWLLAAGLGPALAMVRAMEFGEARSWRTLDSLGFGAASSSTSRGSASRATSTRCRRARSCSPASHSVRVTAPRVEAQLLETLLLNQINFQTMVATKAARIALAAGGGAAGGGAAGRFLAAA